MKLSRKQIREGLDQIPIETVILGAVNNSGVSLTPKQKRFAEELAKGETKAGAYRKAYKSKGNAETQAKRGWELAQRGEIVGYSESIKAALEAQRFATPAHLRALTIHELTKGATDPEMPPAQRVKCLELLGKITEVALFTERREVIKVNDSEKARETLLESIKAAINAQAVDVEYTDADDLLAELTVAETEPAPGDAETVDAEPHPPATPLDSTKEVGGYTHTNPHNGSPTNTEENFPGTQPNVFSPAD